MIIELEIISDIIKTDKLGRNTIVKRNDKIKKLFNIHEIDVEEYVNPRNGNHIPKYSLVISNNVGFKVNKPYEQLKSIIQNKSIPVLGFASKVRSYKC